MKKFLPIILIIAAAAVLRFFQLGIMPPGVSDDELTFIYNAYSISKTGRDVVGEFLPFIIWMNPYSTPILPGQVYLVAPLFSIFQLSATVGRMPSAILGIADVFILYLLVKKLFRNENLALLSALFLAISPWHIHFSRIAYDTNIAAFFVLLGIYLYFLENGRKRMPIFSLISFFAAAYTYRADNLLLLPVFLILSWFGKTNLKLSRRQFIFSIGGFIIITLSLFLTFILNGPKYTSEAKRFYNNGELETQISEFKGPPIIRQIFLNKFTYSVYRIRENYTKSFSPTFLFLHTESEKIYSIWSRGRIYFIDLLFIIPGFVFIFKLNKKSWSFVFLLLLASALPTALSGPPYSARNYFMSIILPIFSAGGVMFLYSIVKNQRIRKAFVFLIIASFAYVLSGYLFDYYGRYAVYAAEPWFKSSKDISTLIALERNKYDRVVIGSSSLQEFIQYSFYSKADPKLVQAGYKESKGAIFKIQNVIFTPECLIGESGKAPVIKGYGRVLYIVPDRCPVEISPNKLIKDYYGNIIWKIYYLPPSST